MRSRWFAWYMMLATGCGSTSAVRNDESATPKVALSPFTNPPTGVVQAKFNIPAPSQEAAVRVEMAGRKLIGENPQAGLRPNLVALGSAEPEIFHVGLNNLYVTEGLVKQCTTEGQLAAALANELGRMVSEREAAISDEIRRPEPLRPMHVPIAGNGNSREADPTYLVEMARFDKQYPKQTQKLAPPNPQNVARSLLEKAGYQRTELDAVQPVLDGAARFSTLENQFKGTARPGDWKQP